MAGRLDRPKEVLKATPRFAKQTGNGGVGSLALFGRLSESVFVCVDNQLEPIRHTEFAEDGG